MSTLFDDGPATPTENLSQGRRRTIRQHALLDIGVHPATGAPLARNGETCGTCLWSWIHRHNSRNYWKCAEVPATRGAATDIRLSWPACTMWQSGRGRDG